MQRDPRELLHWAHTEFQDRFAITTSFQDEGMVLIDLASQIDPGIRVLTLDTGRLPEETHRMIETVRERYAMKVDVVSPGSAELERMVTRHGPNLFHRDPSLRKLCCHIRKTLPLERALGDCKAWAVGLRRGQSEERAAIEQVEHKDGRVKLSPLAHWSEQQVAGYLRERGVPRHPLYAQGYASIGCAPCTRALRDGESGRDGRWWWEGEAAKECGIHLTPEGAMRRALDVLLEDILVR
ncbi:MAG: phosphoadenylyl-sulfate reductase [Bryobacteraceae bacterium]